MSELEKEIDRLFDGCEDQFALDVVRKMNTRIAELEDISQSQKRIIELNRVRIAELEEDNTFLKNLSDNLHKRTSALEEERTNLIDAVGHAIEYRSRWISVDDRLPSEEESESYKSRLIVKTSHMAGISAAYFYTETSEWVFSTDGRKILDATHWQAIEV